MERIPRLLQLFSFMRNVGSLRVGPERSQRRLVAKFGGDMPHYSFGCFFSTNMGKGIGMSRMCNFSKSIKGEGAEDEKCSRYHQNPDEIIFLFRIDPISYHHWGGGSQSMIGGGGLRHRGLHGTDFQPQFQPTP